MSANEVEFYKILNEFIKEYAKSYRYGGVN